MPEAEEIIATVREFKGKRVAVRVVRVRLADGTESTRDIVKHPDSVAIVAVDDERNVLFVRQYRTAIGSELLELPAGVLDDGEDPQTAAQRELREETGYAADRLIELGGFYAAPGSVTEYLYSFVATRLRHDPLSPDDDERIVLERVPLADAIGRARSGELHDAKTIASLMMAEAHLAAIGG